MSYFTRAINSAICVSVRLVRQFVHFVSCWLMMLSFIAVRFCIVWVNFNYLRRLRGINLAWIGRRARKHDVMSSSSGDLFKHCFDSVASLIPSERTLVWVCHWFYKLLCVVFCMHCTCTNVSISEVLCSTAWLVISRENEQKTKDCYNSSRHIAWFWCMFSKTAFLRFSKACLHLANCYSCFVECDLLILSGP